MRHTPLRVGILLFTIATCATGALRPEPPGPLPLWKVRARHSTLYILGSIHILKTNDYPLPGRIEDAFAASRTVLFETDLDKMQEPWRQRDLADRALLPPGKTLANVLSPDTYRLFQKEVERLGLTADLFDRTSPYVAAMTLEVFSLKKLGLAPDYGIDRYFLERARNQGKTVLTVEPVEFQFDLVTRLSQPEAEQLMRNTLEDMQKIRDISGELWLAWRTGDVEKLDALLRRSMRGVPETYKRTVLERNHQWLPRLEELLRSPGIAMVIVGAGHLVGPEGLIELLRADGYKVVQL